MPERNYSLFTRGLNGVGGIVWATGRKRQSESGLAGRETPQRCTVETALTNNGGEKKGLEKEGAPRPRRTSWDRYGRGVAKRKEEMGWRRGLPVQERKVYTTSCRRGPGGSA